MKLAIPGQDDRLFVRDPHIMKTVLDHDGKNPIEPSFDHLVFYRNKIRKDLFTGTAGVVGSHGEEWYQNRSQVKRSKTNVKKNIKH